MRNRQPDYYAILGLTPDAKPDEIQKAASTLASKFPEETRDPAANPAYRQLVAAYEVLSDAEKRAAYDAQRAQRAPELLEVHLLASREEIPTLSVDQLLYVLMTIRAPSQREKRVIPVNLSLVFDRSTSMRGDRLERVKAAARQVVEKLSPTDVISVVSFSDRAEVVSAAAYAEDKSKIIQRILGVGASGGTEIYQGLRAGVDEMRRARLSHYVNHLVLMTDGHTYGDDDECLQLAEEAAKQGIMFSAFGIGEDWNDRFLDQLVSASGGRSVYIDHPDKIISYLREQISGLGTIYANNVRLIPQFPLGVHCNYAIKLSPFSQPLSTGKVLQLGAVEGRSPLSILLELKIEPQRAGGELSITLDLMADIPSAQVHERTFKYVHALPVVRHNPPLAPPAMVVKAVELLSLYRMNEKAWSEFEAGNTPAATRQMEYLTTRLIQAGHTKLAEQAMMEKQRLENLGTASLAGKKQLKYGTRALITTAMSLGSNV